MLTLLPTLKSRLSLLDTDATYDALLTNAIKFVSARFDKETNRTLARTTDCQQEFPADDTEIPLACYPVESVTKFELKTSEATGWQEQPTPDHLIRAACVLSFNLQLSTCNLQPGLARITYTGGYVLPGTTAEAGQTPLPPDLEQACVEQVAFWFQTREKLGIKTTWPHLGTYEQFATQDLLPSVQSVLSRYTRYEI